MHNAVLISMPTNLTQSKKVTLCWNQKEASLFQNCMLGSLQADRFSEWDSLEHYIFHLTALRRGKTEKQCWFLTNIISPLWEKAFFAKKGRVGSLSSVFGSFITNLLNSFSSLCLSPRHSETMNKTAVEIYWVGFTSFLWLCATTIKMGALEDVFDVFVFRAGSGSPLDALMSWCGVWCWPSNLLWCSGPGVHLSILSLFHTVY